MKTAVAEKLRSVLRLHPAPVAILLFLSVFYLPFINKAFHIDDPVFINLAQMFDWNPLKAIPVTYDYIYMGRSLPNITPYETTHPLLIPYFIKLFTALFGQSEPALHLAFSVFPAIAIWSLIKLNNALFPDTRRISPAYMAVLFFTMPAFLVNAQNIMTDVPSLAFLLLAMAGYICGTEQPSRRMIWLGCLAFTLAIFSSYQMLAFLPLIVVYLLWRRTLSLHVIAALVLPLAALFIWLIAVYYAYDIFPLLKSKLAGTTVTINDEIKRGLDVRNLIGKFYYILAYLGSTAIWVIAFHHSLKKSLGRFFVTSLLLMSVSCLAIWNFTGYPAATNIMLALFIALGLQTIGTLGLLIRENIRDARDVQQSWFLFAWFLCVIGYNFFLLPFGASRYLLPALPPLFLLVMNNPVWDFPVRQRLLSFTCILGGSALFALGAAYSDYRYAETYRTFAGEVVKIRAEVGSSPEFWYIGEWGMRHYMNKAGARVLPAASDAPKVGDFVVIPEMPKFWAPAVSLQQRLVFFAERRFSSSLSLRLFNRRSNAGFYSHLWGMLPFAFSTEPDEVFTVLRVIK